MTAETEVRSELSEVSKVAIEDKCGLDMSSYEDLPKVGGDCNGVNKHVDDDKEEDAQDTSVNVNVNVNGKDDPNNGSCVFVSINGDLIERDLNAECVHKSPMVPECELGFVNKDVEGQVGELNDENGETVSVEHNCIAEGTDVAFNRSMVKPYVDGVGVMVQDQNATAVMESDGKATIEEQFGLDSATDLEENVEIPTMDSEVGHCGTPQLEDGKIESQEETKLESTVELGEVQESQIATLEVGNLHDGEEQSKEQNNLVSNAHFKENKETKIVLSEVAECKSSVLDDGKVNSMEHVDKESTTELKGSQEFQIMSSEAPECESPEVEVGKVIVEKQMKESPGEEFIVSVESQIRMPQSAESESYQLENGEQKFEEEDKTDMSMDIVKNQESQLAVTDNVSRGIGKGNEAAELANENDIPLDTAITNEHVLDENKDSCPGPHVEDSISQAKVLNELIDGNQNTTERNCLSENAESLPSPGDCMKPEIVVGSEPFENVCSCPAKDAKLEIEIKNDTVGSDLILSCNEVNSETDIRLPSFDPERKVSTLSCADVNIESEVPNRTTDRACTRPIAGNGLVPEHHGNDVLLNGSGADMKSESEVENFSSISRTDMPCNDAAVSQSGVLDGSVVNCGTAANCVTEALDVQEVGDHVSGGDGDDYDNLTCRKTEDTACIHRDEISTPSPERCSADALDEQSAGVEAMKRPFHFLVKIPRYDDEKLREQIRDAQLQVDEKTQRRDAIRIDIQRIRANCEQLHNSYEAAKTEERTARGLVRLKRQDIDAVQSVINRVKNAISVEDIDVRIQKMEHMIQHETLLLKEEKQFIREIKQLKHLREQLSSNMGSQDEVQQALDQRDQIEDRLKILKKELDCLKDKVSKAEATAAAAEKKYNDESKKLRELHNQFRAADDIRQEAYMHLQNLRRKLYEKNTRFRMYKDDAMAANDYALSGDKEALHRLCVNQVETVMELWNKNDEFRTEYLRCNTRSTLRRLRTLDGLALGPDEVPIVLPNVVDGRIDKSHSTPGKADSDFPVLTLEQEKQVSTAEVEDTDGKSMAKVVEQMDQTAKTKKPVKLTLRNESTTVFSRGETKEMSEEKHEQTMEQQELTRKEEELRKEEAAAKLKEQRRLEEKFKAKEALERKRKNAEKAQIRAELRAHKEAEQKEKEREKRAKKKERKKAVAVEAPDGNNGGETDPTSESPVVTTKEPKIKESPLTTTKRAQKPFHFAKQCKTKSIPPPLRNRGKRRLQQWIWVILAALIVLAMFLLVNIGFYSSLGHNLRMRS